jgi:hypothetical protein
MTAPISVVRAKKRDSEGSPEMLVSKLVNNHRNVLNIKAKSALFTGLCGLLAIINSPRNRATAVVKDRIMFAKSIRDLSHK